MDNFNKKTAIRIATVSFILSLIASPVAWLVAKESIEDSIVSLAIEESGRLLHHHKLIELKGPAAREYAGKAANSTVGGLFDIVEIYDQNGYLLARATTSKGSEVAAYLPPHGTPNYTQSFYETHKLPNENWALRVFVPLRSSADTTQPITGFFEGVRIIPEWQQQKIFTTSLTAAVMVGLSALLCGLIIYPVVVHLSRENQRKTTEVLDSHISMMEALGRAIAKRDSNTGAHNYRVAWISARIAGEMGIKGSEMRSLIAGSFLHDVGKIGIPDAILLKPGKLDEEEFTIMRTHVQQGEEIVIGMGWLDGARDVVAAHHEKWNGCGYPNNLAGEAIPLSARIFAVADVFDALCSKRPYKEPMGFDEAMAVLINDTGTHFDPAVMAVFREISIEVYRCLENSTENDARELLQELIRKYFAM